MNLIPFQAVYPNLNLISSPESFFSTVKNQFPDYMNSGFFKKAPTEGIYIYQIKAPTGHYVGVITCTDIADLQTGKILKHENTLAAKEQEMMHIVLQNKALVKPILLAYDGVKELDEYFKKIMTSNEPFFEVEFKEDGETHTVWTISDGMEVETVRHLFEAKVKKAYIADGHHRAATAVSMYENTLHLYDQESMRAVLTIYFPFHQLKIYDYNRVIEIFQDLTPIEFIVHLSKFCDIKPLRSAAKPKAKHEMTLFIQKQWYRLKWKKKILRNYPKGEVLLDADLLNKYVLFKICDILNVREDKRLRYVEGIAGTAGVATEVNKNEYRAGFCLYPVSADELKKIADHKKTLPPKSTWFEPRVKNGMIVKEL